MDQTTDERHWDAAQEGAELIVDGEHQAAITELKDRIRDDSGNCYAYFFLGAALFEQGELLQALKAYLRCVELKPDYDGALISLGRTLHALGRFQEGLRVARQVLTKEKFDPDGLHLMGVCHFAMGDGAAADRFLRMFLDTRPEIEVALEVEGMLKVIQGDTVPAEEVEAGAQD